LSERKGNPSNNVLSKSKHANDKSFKLGNKGGPGRAVGSKTKFQVFVEEVGQDYLLKALHFLGKAASGELSPEEKEKFDPGAIRLLIETMPKPKARSWVIDIQLPPINCIEDINKAFNAIDQAINNKAITITEAQSLADYIKTRAEVIEYKEVKYYADMIKQKHQ